MGWKSINSAPRDGTLVEIRRLYQGHEIARAMARFGDLTVDYCVHAGERNHRYTFTGVWIIENENRQFISATQWRRVDECQPGTSGRPRA